MSAPRQPYPKLRLLLLASALPLLNLCVYAWTSATLVISRDQWRLLPMLQDWSEGRFQAVSLWLTHSQHRIPAYKLLFLLDGLVLKLDMRVEILLGCALLSLAILFLVKRFLDTAAVTGREAWLGAAALALLGLSLNQGASIVYGLGALNGFGRVAAFLCFWLCLDACLRKGASARAILGLGALLVFVLLAWAGGHGPAYLLATFLTVLIASWRGPRSEREERRLLGGLAIAAVGAEAVYWLAGPLPAVHGSTGSVLHFTLHVPLRVVEYGLLALSSSAMPIEGMEHHGWPRILSLLTGAGIGALYLAALLAFFHGQLWKKSWLPGFLMSYSLLLVASIFAARIGSEGMASATAPRYVLDTQLGLLGCFWSLFLWRSGRPAGSRAWPERLMAVPVLFAAVLLLELGDAGLMWAHSGEQRRMAADAVEQVRAGDFQSQDWICPDEGLCKSGADYMRQQRLNVFRDQAP